MSYHIIWLLKRWFLCIITGCLGPGENLSFFRRDYSVDQNSDLLLDQKLSSLFITCNVRTRYREVPQTVTPSSPCTQATSAFKTRGLFKHFMRWNWLAVTGSSIVSGCHVDVKSCLQGGMLQGARAHADCLVRTRTGSHWVGLEESACVLLFVYVQEVRDLWAFKESCSYQNFSWISRGFLVWKQHVVLVALSNFPLVPDVSSLGAIWLWVEVLWKLFKTRTPGPQPQMMSGWSWIKIGPVNLYF